MAVGYRIPEPSGKLVIFMADSKEELQKRVIAS